MKIGKSHYLSVIAAVTVGCASPGLPELVKAPEPPDKWKVSEEKQLGCPNVTGEYGLTPMVAVFQNDASWQFSIGSSYDYILLLPFDRVSVLKRTPEEASFAFSKNGLLFESSPLGDILRITSPVLNSNSFETQVLEETNNDFKCDAGNLVFPEFKIQGGSEGSDLNGRVYRQATITLSGDLLFYEQVRGYRTVHKYYLFKLKQ